MLEILAGIPSVVYGYFALTFITPVLQKIYPGTEVFNAASASIALGIMILPMVASLSEDAMMAIPDSIRNGAYALGSTKFEVATKIVVPASISGIVSAFVLAVSRAIGETMVVAIAAGASPKLTFNPFESVQTMTGYMVNVALGDIQHGTIMYKTVFAVGAVLFIITFIMNIIAKLIVKKVGEAY
jgi:phosphate transport system permease protein